ncbi:MAG: hypothetical protein RBG13Loki_3573 [Promethearchaeota archaeon CR_4]|nr:MAG: hypothetical protein RBG13Loki_3573 [Candidatus Lokiarchaeota archaeon CR_4]
MTLNFDKSDETAKKSKGKSGQDYIPPPLPIEPNATKESIATTKFVNTLRQATPHGRPTIGDTQSKTFSKLTATEKFTLESTIPSQSQTKTPAVPKKNPPPSRPGTRIIIKPIKTVTTIPGNPNPVVAPIITSPILIKNLAPVVGPPVPPTPSGSSLPTPPREIESKLDQLPITQVPEEIPEIIKLDQTPIPETPEEEQPTPIPSFDWNAIRAQSDLLWNYIEQLLIWLQEMAAKSDQIPRPIVIERVNTIRLKIEQHFGITFSHLETENLETIEILRMAMEYVRYLQENFNPNYYFCPSCKHIVAFYYPVPVLPCPICGSKLVSTSPERSGS